MAGPKYPLNPLLKLRERQVEGATAELAKAITAREVAEAARVEAEQAEARAEAEAQAVRDAEANALERGELRAGDLHRAQAWEMGVAADQKRLEASVATAEQREAGAKDQEDAARRDLATREANAQVVEKDKSRFDDKSERVAAAKEEEAAAEAFGSRGRDSK
jgi:colicin import membrane protein